MSSIDSLLISACLIGVNCKYNGCNNFDDELYKSIKGSHRLILICPEQLGGLPTPRKAAEITGSGRVMTVEGTDVTSNFVKGAEESLRLAEIFGAKKAILKERSPSCGVNQIYDGSFTGKLINGSGITGALLKKQGILLATEENFHKLLKK